MKSERMKTELITNVSHDIKTPLTSIVNYVDLLSKEPQPTAAAQEYVAVLERQSLRLKKLIEDLVEASKASTGSLAVTLEPVDLCEFLQQAAAEYAEPLEQAQLHPVVQTPEGRVYALADGKHLWRILDNLLGNACKYSQPGTRLYLSLVADGEQAHILVKNISREPLNISADELMERFVRGDSARSTEGSGLGLSIARSLADIQGAGFSISIDGDLFKAQITLKRLTVEQP
jgi:signal transduction histidine kinase